MRLFIASWPAPEVLEVLRGISQPAVEGLRWVRPDHWHVTLRFLGEVADPGAVLAGLESSSAGLGAPVVARAGPATEVLGPVLCVPVAGLAELAFAVSRATAGVGRQPEKRQFRGHITLARLGRGRDKVFRLESLAGSPLDTSWRVDRVSLVSSETRPEGPRYEVLAEVGLGRK
jgi:2'-5' RNA ligase